MVELPRNNGRSESVNAEGGAAAGESPRGAIPTAERELSGVEANAAATVGESPRGEIPTDVRPTSRPAGLCMLSPCSTGRRLGNHILPEFS